MSDNYNVLNSAKYFEKLFDFIRIVDPVNKKIVSFPNNNIFIEKHECYELWNSGKICKNCISYRAYNENNTFVKVEYNGEKIYWVMATPIKENGITYVMETLRDITHSGIIEDIKSKTNDEIQNEINRMNTLVVTDELTGIFNRRYINERLPVDIEKVVKCDDNRRLTVVIMDIDYFKNINDLYGHSAGDYVLQEIVKIIKKNMNNSIDWLARYGGEEFIIVYNNIKCKDVDRTINKLKYLISETEFIYNKKIIRVTASFGVCCANDKNNSFKIIMENADENLYKAKSDGRNRVICNANKSCK